MSWVAFLFWVAAFVVVAFLLVGLGAIFASSDTPEASDLQGFPGTLGDFPPLGAWENSAALITHVDLVPHAGEFPEGQRVGRVEDGEYKGVFIADGKGGYIEEEK